jgi:hypothetical protein
MSTQTLQMINLSVNDLTDLISNCVKAELQKINEVIQLNPKTEAPELLTREEASKMLKVSYTTLFNWNNSGSLPAQTIGNRVYYQRSMIMNKLNSVA